MSILGSVYIGVSGMDAYTQGLQAIANNVANLNTPGYKATTVTFADVFNPSGGLDLSSDSGGGQAGNGVRYGTPQVDFSQGTLQQTTGSLDLAIQGGGFMVLLNGSQTLYTRTGQFAVDKSGFISDPATGYHLAILNSAGQPTALNVNTKGTSPAVATSNITFANNVSSTATTASVSNISVFDSNGARHTWTVSLAPAVPAVSGQWQVTVTDETNATVGTGTITFTGSTITPAASKVTINTTPAGAAALSVVLDFSNVTSFSSGTTSTLSSASVDGNASGNLTTVTVDANGQVQLAYSNGKTVAAGAVAMANFQDPQQLERLSNQLFQNVSNSQPPLFASGENGAGKIVSQQIETSNVNLALEFGDLILIQRGFEASSQVVSIANDMIQNLFGLRGHG